MPGSWPADELPHLTDEACEVMSSATRRYNCIAWASANVSRWWWPDRMNIGYWPPNVPREETVPVFMLAYEAQGYVLCFDESLQPGIEKIALFGHKMPDGKVIPTHAAIQLESGKWSSKLGPFEDISHKNVDDVRGPAYGERICCMSRPRKNPTKE